MTPPRPSDPARAAAKKAAPAEKLTKAFKTAAAWERWLARHHASATGIWIKYARKDSGIPSVRYAEAVEAALCYGWIDGQVKSLDEQYYVQKFTPRGTRSIWSKINREKVRMLEEAGRMKPAGAAAVLRARENGQWDAAYDSSRTATVPPDLAAALAKAPAASKLFEKLSGQNRYAILFRLQTAKRAETRSKRIRLFVEQLRRGETIYPQ